MERHPRLTITITNTFPASEKQQNCLLKKIFLLCLLRQIINTAIGFITSIIMTRILGTEGRGENTIFLNSVGFSVLFFGFSINSTISYFINSGKAKAGELLSTIIILVISSTILVYGSLFFLDHAGELHVALPAGSQAEKYKLIFTGVYFSTLLNGIANAYLITFKKFTAVSFFGVGVQLLTLVIYVLVYLKVISYDHLHPFKTVVNITAVVALITFIAVVILFVYVLRIRPSRKFIPLVMVKQFVFFSSMAYIGNIASFLNYKLDFWIVNEYCGTSKLGVYSLAAQLSQLLWILPQAVSSVLYSYASSSNQTDAVHYTIQLKRLSFYGTLLLGITGLILAYFFIPVLYGKEFSYAYNLFVIFLIGVVPYSVPTVLASLFASRGNFKTSFVISMITFAISCVLYFTLIPHYGLIGGAVSSAIAYLLAALITELWFCKMYHISIFNLFKIKKEIFSLSAILKNK